MFSLLREALGVLTDDPESLMAAASGSVTDSILHPRKLLPCLLKAVAVGFFLSEFVSPAIAEKLDLTRKEAIALSFVCGYAGIRGLKLGEEILTKKLQVADKSTLPSKEGED